MSETFSVSNEPPAFYTREELLLALRTLVPAAGLVDGVTITINGSGKLQLSGTLDAALISALDAAILTGVLPASTLPTIPWSKIEAGTIPGDRIPTIPKEKVGGILASLVDGTVALATKAATVAGYYDSGWIASGILAADVSKSYPHGLSDYPGLVDVWLRWPASPPTGYAVNEAIHINSFGASSTYPMVVCADATNVRLSLCNANGSTATGFSIISNSSWASVAANLTTAQVRIIARLTSQTGI